MTFPVTAFILTWAGFSGTPKRITSLDNRLTADPESSRKNIGPVSGVDNKTIGRPRGFFKPGPTNGFLNFLHSLPACPNHADGYWIGSLIPVENDEMQNESDPCRGSVCCSISSENLTGNENGTGIDTFDPVVRSDG